MCSKDTESRLSIVIAYVTESPPWSIRYTSTLIVGMSECNPRPSHVIGSKDKQQTNKPQTSTQANKQTNEERKKEINKQQRRFSDLIFWPHSVPLTTHFPK